MKRRIELAHCSALIVASGLLGLATHQEVGAQEICYQDESGRILERRVPGAIQVPCPDATAPSIAPSGPPGAQAGDERQESVGPVDGPASARRALPRPDPLANRRRNPVSPIPRPTLDDYSEAVPLPDRWRIVDALGYEERLLDPYNRNLLKADRPIHGDDWFFNLGLISDTIYEVRQVVTPVGVSTTEDAGSIDVFGGSDQWAAVQNLAMELVYYKGDTVFKPPDYEFRLVPVFNYNYTRVDELLGVNVDPREGRTRRDSHVGIQGAFFDIHLRNVSDRYDFDSFRVGIQPFSSDFRGFLFQDNQLGLRYFGTRNNNRLQFNVGVFRRLEKDTNSGLNDLSEIRDDDVLVFNVYRQDMPVLGFTSQATVLHNRNREDQVFFDHNGFIQRPSSLGQERLRHYDVTYVGYNGDGHLGRLNLTASVYGAFGSEKQGVFTERESDIEAYFAALELSRDFNWARWRLSFLYGSGDEDPFDDKAGGFDAIFENPQFAGADTSYWVRQAVPLVGGGRVALSGRNGVLNSLRSSKEQGQSNFTNPGIWLLGLGVDFDLTPTLRLSANANALRFDETAVLEAARNQGPIDEEIGLDASLSLTWRPMMTQNIVLRASYAQLLAGDGFKALFPDENPGYFLLNLVLAY